MGSGARLRTPRKDSPAAMGCQSPALSKSPLDGDRIAQYDAQESERMLHETNRAKVAGRLKREGWIEQHGGRHDLFIHAAKPGVRIVVPRHRTLSPGVARDIALEAGW